MLSMSERRKRVRFVLTSTERLTTLVGEIANFLLFKRGDGIACLAEIKEALEKGEDELGNLSQEYLGL